MAARWLHSDVNPVDATVATALAVEIGDIVGMAAGTVKKASETTWDTNLATTQTAFALTFLGLAGQKKTAAVARVYGNSNDNEMRIDTAGVFEFDCASATFEVGDRVGPAKDTGDLLLNDKVVGVATDALSIGRVVERGTSITKVKVRLQSTLNPLAKQS